jgi:hypothetical protein
MSVKVTPGVTASSPAPLSPKKGTSGLPTSAGSIPGLPAGSAARRALQKAHVEQLSGDGSQSEVDSPVSVAQRSRIDTS